MGTNFHTAWDISTLFKPTSMDPALASLDKGITYLKNIVVSCRGNIYCDLTAGTLVWDDIIYIYFIKENGSTISNYIGAGSAALGVGQIAYVDLVETSGTPITIYAGTPSVVGVNRLVLAHRDLVGDGIVYPIFPVRLPLRIPRSLEKTKQTTDATVTTLATLTLQDNTTYLITAEVVANQSTHANRATYIRRALVYRAGGNAILEGSIQDGLTVESDAVWNCTIDANSTNARVLITGKATTIIDWMGKVSWLRI